MQPLPENSMQHENEFINVKYNSFMKSLHIMKQLRY